MFVWSLSGFHRPKTSMLGKLHRVSLVSNCNLAVGLNKSVNALLSLCHRALSVLYFLDQAAGHTSGFLDSIIDLVSYPPSSI